MNGAILGPCSCQRCGVLVWWARVLEDGQLVRAWRNRDGSRHVCALAA